MSGNTKPYVWCLTFLLLWPTLSLAANDELVFQWAFLTRSSEQSNSALDLSTSAWLNPDDEIRIIIKPLASAYIYLFHLNTDNHLEIIFPAEFDTFSSDEYFNKTYFLPNQYDWLTLQEAKGTDKFFLLASDQRFSLLETLTKVYKNSHNLENKSAVLTEIIRLRKKHSRQTVAAEIGLSIAGTIQTKKLEADSLNSVPSLTEVRARGFYGKTIRLKNE